MVAVRQSEATLQPRGGSGDPVSLPRDSNLVDEILRRTQYLYALVLLLTFVSFVAWYSVYNAKKDDDIIQSHLKGPGGKPLPITKRKKRDNGERKLGPHFGLAAKNVFRYLAAIVFLSYVGTGISMFVHAFKYENPEQWSREGLPWAGEWSVVSFYPIDHVFGGSRVSQVVWSEENCQC